MLENREETNARLQIRDHPVPLRAEPDGTVRIGKSRVTLDVFITAFKLGSSAEQIAEDFDTVKLADTYSVLGYYLTHRSEVEEYLRARAAEAEKLWAKIEKEWGSSEELWERLNARREAAEAASNADKSK